LRSRKKTRRLLGIEINENVVPKRTQPKRTQPSSSPADDGCSSSSKNEEEEAE
jgi:hypothetical protein